MGQEGPRRPNSEPSLAVPNTDCRDCSNLREQIVRIQSGIAEDEKLPLDLQKAKTGFEAELRGYPAARAAFGSAPASLSDLLPSKAFDK
jgi:hypothetical protein